MTKKGKITSAADLSARINAFIAATDAVAIKLNQPPEDVRDALAIALDLDSQADAMDEDLSVEQMITVLRNHSFEKPELIGEIEFDESILPEETPVYFREASAKHANVTWRIHKCDADPFPSNPHAHCLEQNLTLHLGTGELFRRKTCVGKLDRKGFLALRTKLGEKMPNVDFPTLEVT